MGGMVCLVACLPWIIDLKVNRSPKNNACFFMLVYTAVYMAVPLFNPYSLVNTGEKCYENLRVLIKPGAPVILWTNEVRMT